jgi:hypothetical protein
MDSFFGLDAPALQDDDNLTLLTTVYDDILADLYAALLKEENVPFLKKDRSGGGALRMILGTSNQGVDFYVPPSYLEAASNLLFATPEESEDFDA